MNRHLLNYFLIANMALVTAGAFRLPIASIPCIGIALEKYGLVTGTTNGFGFFCSVPSQLRPRFFIESEFGVEEVFLFKTPATREAELRLLGTISVFKDLPDLDLRKNLIRSWAASLFGRYPSANRLTVYLEILDVPSGIKIEQGVKPSWKLVDKIEVTR